jgi:hypothetical protein
MLCPSKNVAAVKKPLESGATPDFILKASINHQEFCDEIKKLMGTAWVGLYGMLCCPSVGSVRCCGCCTSAIVGGCVGDSALPVALVSDWDFVVA